LEIGQLGSPLLQSRKAATLFARVSDRKKIIMAAVCLFGQLTLLSYL
jgi:hypothetical protein